MITDILLSISIVALIVLGTHVVTGSGGSRAALHFGLYCFVAAIIALIEVLTHYAPSETVARAWGQVAAVWPLAWVFYAQFSMEGAGMSRRRRHLLTAVTVVAALAIAASYFVLARRGSVVVQSPDHGFALESPFIRTPLGLIVATGYAFVLTITITVLVRGALRAEGPSRRRQILWILLAYGLGFAAGVGLVLLRELAGLQIREVNGFSYLVTASVIYIGIARRHLIHLTPRLIAQQALDRIDEFFVLTDERYRVVVINDAAVSMVGSTRQDLVGCDVHGLMGIAPGESCEGDRSVVNDRGERVVLSVSETVITNHLDETVGRTLVGKDITDVRRRERQLQTLLTEKNMVVQELHHRVKNTLQLIDGLVSLKVSRLESPDAVAVYGEITDRIRVIANVYNEVYAHGELRAIALDRALHDVCAQQTGVVSCGTGIAIETSLDGVEVSAERAIPLLLAVAELLANALQHAYPPGAAGLVRVESKASADGNWSIVVADDGRGIPGEPPAGSVGITLAHELARQVDGSLELDERHGVTWTLTFPLESSRVSR